MRFKTFIIFSLVFASVMAGENLKFSHKYHIQEEELGCADCHKAVLESESLDKIKAFALSACADCHDDPTFDSTYTFTVTDTGFPTVYDYAPGSLTFSHKKHSEEKVECKSCHGELGTKALHHDYLSNMTACMDCHTKKANVSCDVCHPNPAMPADHSGEFWVSADGHGLESSFRENDCKVCHQTKAACTDCHMGADGRQIHGLNYRYTHGVDVTFKRLDCSVCHQPAQLFCGDCHERLGVPR